MTQAAEATPPNGDRIAGVFEGNTADPRTLAAQVDKLEQRFQLGHVVLVGDRGMIAQARIAENITPAGLDWITALRAPAIGALLESGALQLSVFDQRDMASITAPEFPRRASGRVPQSRSRRTAVPQARRTARRRRRRSHPHSDSRAPRSITGRRRDLAGRWRSDQPTQDGQAFCSRHLGYELFQRVSVVVCPGTHSRLVLLRAILSIVCCPSRGNPICDAEALVTIDWGYDIFALLWLLNRRYKEFA